MSIPEEEFHIAVHLSHCEAVVLRAEDYGESDKIIILFSPTLGKLTTIAKGAKKSKRRFVNKLEPFTYIEASCHFRRNFMPRLEQAELVQSFPLLREDYRRFFTASLIIELIQCWTREHDADTRLFQLLIWAMTSVHEGKPLGPLLIGFSIKLLEVVGYRPRLENCCHCRSKISSFHGTLSFSIGKNGVICARCLGQATFPTATSNNFISLSHGTTRLLHMMQNFPLNKLDRVRFSPQTMQEALRVLRYYNNALLGREIRGWRFVMNEI